MTTNYKPRQPTEPCPREGCPGKSFEGEKYCSFTCRAVAQELENTLRICQHFGGTPLSTDVWTEAVAMSDAYSRYLEQGYRLRMQAKRAGVDWKQWQDIRRGRQG